MSARLYDRVLESATTTGTGAFTLAAAYAGYRRFRDVYSVNDLVAYVIEAVDGNGNPSGDWETGLGTYSGTDTLTRTTVQASSNAGAAVNFAAGTKRVFSSATAGVLTTAVITLLISDPSGTAITTGDGKAYWPVPATLNGSNLIACRAVLDTAGTGGGFLLQLRRKRSGSDVDMLSTRISIDSGENDSNDATTPPVIDATKDDVATGDRIYFDVDGVPTGGKGLTAELTFRQP